METLNNGSALLTITLPVHREYYQSFVATDGLDGYGLQLEKFGNFFKFVLGILEKLLKADYS